MKEQFTDNTELILALKLGEPKAYSYLVNTYHHKLCVYAYSFTHDHNLSEDIVQNVFMRIWNKRENLKDDFSIINFLYKSVYNEFIDQYRTQKSFYPLEKKYIDALNTIVESEDEHSLERIIKVVKREIQNLPPKCKEIFLLSKEEGLTNIEIAEYKNVSIKSVEAHITKAFSILRNSLGDKADLYLFLMFR
ncbi:RNA polymerase sigma factor [Flavobacterium flavipallidum]|uniref:RNA polymerase sigma-70 factor n=1 Tax=Flavobacterium flavipallidum TaxID=3139140 RepID=A0ABU9HR39_9FLAO